MFATRSFAHFDSSTSTGWAHLQRLEIERLEVVMNGDAGSISMSAESILAAPAAGGAANLGRLELHREWRFRAHVEGLDEERPRARFERIDDEE